MWKIEFDKKDLARWMRAKNKLATKVGPIAQYMLRDCALEYIVDVREAIGKRFRPTPDYSTRYASWKFEYGRMGYPSPWRLFGDLVNSLTAWQENEREWYGGVPRGTYDAGGKSWFGTGATGGSKEIAMYGWVEEMRRPLFGPVRDEYFEKKMPEQGKKALGKLLDLWR